MKNTFLAWIAFAVMQASCANGQEVLFAVENSWPPYADKNGDGISKTLVKSAFAGSEFSPKFITVPYARALYLTEIGKVHGCFNVTRQADTEQRFLFGEQVLLRAQASHFYPKSSKLFYESIESIPEKTRIALIIGYEYGDVYEQHKHRFHEVRVASQRQIVELLRKGRVDMAIMFDEVAKQTLKDMALSSNTLTKGAINHVSDIYVAFSRARDDVKPVINVLDEGLKRIADNH